MIEDLKELLENVEDAEFVKGMRYKLRNAKRDAEMRGDILGEYLWELQSEIEEQIEKESPFIIGGYEVTSFSYDEHADEYSFYNEHGMCMATIGGKIEGHDELNEEDLYQELKKVFGESE